MDVAAWLRSMGLGQYERAFRDNDIDAALLPSLTEADLRELGVLPLGHRKRLLAAAAALAAGAGEPPPSGAHGAAAEPEAERRQLTVLFCDLVDSTALAARLDPEELRGVVAAYHRRAAEAVERWAGCVAGYMGDGVLAFFGHPQAGEDDAERAARAGLELVEAVRGLAAGGGQALRARVGLATGLVVVGRIMGAAGALERGAVGAAPNLAARLQAAAEPGAVMADAATRRLLGPMFDCRDLGSVDAKGFSGPVPAWRVLRPGAARSRSEALHAGAPSSAPMVGRDEEVGLLLRRWAQAEGGEGRVVLLSGEPGIGKSRLAAGLAERLGDGPHARVRYFCSPHHRDSPLLPVIGQLERAAGFGPDDPPDVRLEKLEALLSPATGLTEEVAFVADLLGLSAGGRRPLPDLSSQQRRERLLAALLGQLSGLAARRPVFVLFEDAHWADPTSLELLGMAVERLRRARALLVVTSRPGFGPSWAGSPHVTALALGGLGRREAASLAARTAGRSALPDGMLERIVERAEGVPLFVEELTRAAVEAGWREDGPARTEEVAAPAGDVPAALQAPLMARLDRLGAAKEVAQVGAAIGHEFPYELLAAVAGRPDAELRGALECLVEAGIVSRTGEPPRASFLFKHALVHDAAYGTLLLARRRELHASIARALERSSPERAGVRPELLARHFALAGMAEEAVGRYAEAGTQAIARSAIAEAAVHLRRALEILPALPDTPARWRRELDLQTALGAALAATEGYTAPETNRVHERARALCERLGDTAGLVQVAVGQCSYHLLRAEIGRALGVAEDLLRAAEGSPQARLTAHRLVGTSLFQAGHLQRACRHLEMAADLLDAAGERAVRMADGMDALVAVPAYRALVLLTLGRYDRARAQDALSLAVAERLARPHRRAMALAASLSFRALLKEDAPPLLDALEQLTADQGFQYWSDYALMLRGLTLARAGEVRRGVAFVRRGAARHDAAGAAWLVPHFLALAAEPVGGREGLALVEEAFARTAATDARFFTPELHRIRGALLAGEGDAGAEADFAEAIGLARDQGAKHWELRAATGLARLRRDQGRDAEARGILAPIHGWFEEGPGTPDLDDARALLGQLG